MRKVVILGSTGSIGTQALEVIACNPTEFQVLALAAYGSHVETIIKQIIQFRPQVVAVVCAQAALSLETELRRLSLPCEVWQGEQGVAECAALAGETGVVLNGITGAVGLEATLRALETSATLALANKESLVVGGALVQKAQKRAAQVVPVDSEHSAIFQALIAGVHEIGMCSPLQSGRSELAEIILTASGGPFRGYNRVDLAEVSLQAALAHPTWSMGPVVTINSSTLMNKALELIEAHLLFNVPAHQIRVVVHPQSVVHSGVTWKDGTSMLQASPPDMRLPIALGLTWPQRLAKVSKALDFTEAQNWTFEPVDEKVFTALRLAREALETSSTHPAVMNAANEVCVEAFLKEKIGYLQIVDTVEKVLAAHSPLEADSLETVLAVEEWARRQAKQMLGC